MQKGKIFDEIISIFSDGELNEGAPYNIFHKIVKAVDFGIPQKRERLIIIGTTIMDLDFEGIWEETKKSILLDYPDYFEPTTVRDAIGNLPVVTESGVIPNPIPQNQYQRYLACDNVKLTNHTQSHHSKKAIERMHKIDNGQNYAYLDEEINSVHSGSYGRLYDRNGVPIQDNGKEHVLIISSSYGLDPWTMLETVMLDDEYEVYMDELAADNKYLFHIFYDQPLIRLPQNANIDAEILFATVYKGNIIKNLIMDCQSYTKYRPNETTGGIFVSWRRKEELPTGA